jgi:methionyl-tRNA formyltransferase
MNIVFMGTPDFAVPSLEAINKSAHKVIAVVTVPDMPKGRGQKLSESPVKQFALANGLKVLQPAKLKNPEFIEAVKDIDPDLIVVVAFRILPPEIFKLPKYGSINLHASLLPKYRGAAPINRAIINGDTQSGVTTFFLKDKVDTGNIILQKSVDINPEDNAGALHDKLMNAGSAVLLETINLIEETKGSPPVSSQDESIASPAPKIFKENCRINWNMPAEKIHNLVRGLSPYPAAFSLLEGKVFKIYKTAVTGINSTGEPGEITITGKEIFVNCSDFLLKIDELQPEGKRRMKSIEYLAGHKLTGGERFMY